MTKGSSAVAIISLILGSSCLAIGGLSFYHSSQLAQEYSEYEEAFQDPNIWYEEYAGAFHHNPQNEYTTCTPLTITFSKVANETMYFCYRAIANLKGVPNGKSYVIFWFNINGNHLITPSLEVHVIKAESPYYSFSAVLQFSTKLLTVGIHSVSIDIACSSTNNNVTYSTLMAMAIPN